MARELADVLHHFLGDAVSGERLGPASLALLSEPDDAFAVAVAWNLAHELARQGLAVAWVTSLADEELLPPDATPGLTRVLSPAQDLAGLARAVSEATAKLAASRAPGLVLVRVPPGWIAPGPAAERVLPWTLQLVAPDLEQRIRAISVARRVAAAHPEARVGAAVHEVRSVREAERAFTALARECAERSDARLASYGLLLDDAELYRSLLARRPLALLRPDARATRALADVASLLRADFACDAG
jgi:hypothetical protein